MSAKIELATGPPSEQVLQVAREELRETPENVKKAIEELRELLRNDDTIYFDDDDETLTIFLRPCKWYAKSAYELMKRIADFKEKNKEFLENLMPEDEKDAFINHNVVNVLKNRDHKGRRVLLVNLGETWNPSAVTTDQIFRIFYIIHELAILEPETQINGAVVIMDYSGLGMKQVKAFGPSFGMRLFSFIQEAMPLRLKEIHIVNQPFVFNMVWTLFKPFIKEKLKKRIHFHGTKKESVLKFMDAAYLPEDFGGKLPKIDYTGAEWYPIAEHYKDHIKKWNSFGLKKK